MKSNKNKVWSFFIGLGVCGTLAGVFLILQEDYIIGLSTLSCSASLIFGGVQQVSGSKPAD